MKFQEARGDSPEIQSTPNGRSTDSLAFGSAATAEEESANEGVLTLTLDDIRQSIARES